MKALKVPHNNLAFLGLKGRRSLFSKGCGLGGSLFKTFKKMRFILCVYIVCLHVCAHECRYCRNPEEGIVWALRTEHGYSEES